MGKSTKKQRKIKEKPTLQPVQPDADFANSKLARALGSVDYHTREKGLQALTLWLTRRPTISDTDMLKIWKGLFFCFWHSDKLHVQTELAERLAAVLPQLKPEVSLLYLSACLRILRREWLQIDRLRLDKFLLLVRCVVQQTFVALRDANWNPERVQPYMEVLQTELLLPPAVQKAIGLAFHVSDVFVPELLKVAAEGQRPGQACMEALLSPFCRMLEQLDMEMYLHRVRDSVFDAIMSELRSPSEGEPLVNYDPSPTAALLWELGAQSATHARNREALYNTSQALERIQAKRSKRSSAGAASTAAAAPAAAAAAAAAGHDADGNGTVPLPGGGGKSKRKKGKKGTTVPQPAVQAAGQAAAQAAAAGATAAGTAAASSDPDGGCRGGGADTHMADVGSGQDGGEADAGAWGVSEDAWLSGGSSGGDGASLDGSPPGGSLSRPDAASLPPGPGSGKASHAGGGAGVGVQAQLMKKKKKKALMAKVGGAAGALALLGGGSEEVAGQLQEAAAAVVPAARASATRSKAAVAAATAAAAAAAAAAAGVRDGSKAAPGGLGGGGGGRSGGGSGGNGGPDPTAAVLPLGLKGHAGVAVVAAGAGRGRGAAAKKGEKAQGGKVQELSTPKQGKESRSKKGVRINLQRNMYFPFGSPAPPAEFRTPPAARPKGSILKKTGSSSASKAER